MSRLFSLVYLSTASRILQDEDLTDILVRSRENNARLGVTGLLLYKTYQFMQLLEGPEHIVKELAAKIRRDPRHIGWVSLIEEPIEEPIEERAFADWSMGFRDLESPEVRQLPGFNEFLELPLTAEALAADLPRTRRLLESFKRTM